MTFCLFILSIFQSLAISLGVGSSTLAITNFFVAIADGKIDDTERRMMGVVYVVLRVAMILILLTTVLLISYEIHKYGVVSLLPFHWGQLLVLTVLFVNALLMTVHLVPTTFGPAIQAGSWYTLGVMNSLYALGLSSFTATQFFLGYATGLMLAIAIVNGIMAAIRECKYKPKKQPR
jgi:hypothetical protein